MKLRVVCVMAAAVLFAVAWGELVGAVSCDQHLGKATTGGLVVTACVILLVASRQRESNPQLEELRRLNPHLKSLF